MTWRPACWRVQICCWGRISGVEIIDEKVEKQSASQPGIMYHCCTRRHGLPWGPKTVALPLRYYRKHAVQEVRPVATSTVVNTDKKMLRDLAEMRTISGFPEH